MKDYSMNSEERKLFILSYEIKDSNIIINFAGGEKNVIPYTEENEKKILDKMNEQIKVASKGKYVEYKKTLRTFLMAGFFGGLIFTISTLLNSEPAIFTGLFGTFSTVSIGAAAVVNSNLNDFKKNKRFLELQSKINTNVKKNKNMTVKTSKKTRNMVKETSNDKDVFNINNFNYVPFDDIETINDNIKREERFNFDYSTVPAEAPVEDVNRPKTRTRRR